MYEYSIYKIFDYICKCNEKNAACCNENKLRFSTNLNCREATPRKFGSTPFEQNITCLKSEI